MTRAAPPSRAPRPPFAGALLALAASLACAGCGAMSGLAQSAPMFLMNAAEPAAGNNGRDALSSVGPEHCRPVESVVTSNGETVPSYGRACQMPDGSWVVTATTDPERAIAAISGSSTPPPSRRIAMAGRSDEFDDWCAPDRQGFIGAPLGVPGGFGFRHSHQFRHR